MWFELIFSELHILSVETSSFIAPEPRDFLREISGICFSWVLDTSLSEPNIHPSLAVTEPKM